MNDKHGHFGFTPEIITRATCPASIQGHYSSVNAWLRRLAAIVGQHRRHPWCTETSYTVYMTLKHIADECYILSNNVHSVCYFNGILIDVECNAYIYNFDWLKETGVSEYSFINHKIDTASTPRRLDDYYADYADTKFILRGETIDTTKNYSC